MKKETDDNYFVGSRPSSLDFWGKIGKLALPYIILQKETHLNFALAQKCAHFLVDLKCYECETVDISTLYC